MQPTLSLARLKTKAKIKECMEIVRQCERYACRTKNKEDRKFLLRMAKQWTKLAALQERDILAAARSAA
jgi:hypothetical protein